MISLVLSSTNFYHSDFYIITASRRTLHDPFFRAEILSLFGASVAVIDDNIVLLQVYTIIMRYVENVLFCLKSEDSRSCMN